MSSDLNTVATRAAEEAGLTLSSTQVDQMSVYLASLQKWNRTINLTSLKLDGFPRDSIQRLIVEPLRGASRLGVVEGRWMDLGSGGGSPAIPMRVVLDQTILTMVESRGRKAAFLRTVCAEARLDHVTVEDSRIEDLRVEGLLGSVALISARALRIDRGIAGIIERVLAPDGRVILFGRTDWGELSDFLEVSRDFADGVTILVPRGTSVVQL